MLNRATQIAISAMGYLAEVYEEGRRLTAEEIAASRRMPKPYVAKVLGALAQAQLVRGVTGPGGGYQLLSEPSSIRLWQIAALFEVEAEEFCPYGPQYCHTTNQCPLHNELVRLQENTKEFMDCTTLEGFQHERPNRRDAD